MLLERGKREVKRKNKARGTFGPLNIHAGCGTVLAMTTKAEILGADATGLYELGAHFGQARSRRHPSMKGFVVGAKNRTDILDLAQTKDQIAAAASVMRTFGQSGATILFVSGKKEFEPDVIKVAESINQLFVAGRWLGGTLTNFSEIKKRLDRLADLSSEDTQRAATARYTKLERILRERERERLVTRFSGIASMTKLPDAVVIVDTAKEQIAVLEAKGKKIPIIGIMNSDCDLSDATFPIVANDASRKTVTHLLQTLADAYRDGRDTK